MPNVGLLAKAGRKLTVGLSVVSCIAMSGFTVAEDLVVFKALGTDIKTGQVLNSDQTLSLPEGSSLVLISKNGQMLKLAGPFEGQPLQKTKVADKGLSQALKALVAEKKSSDELGVTRDTTAVLASASKHGWLPEPWLVDVTKAGNVCVQEGRSPVLWRSEPSSETFKLVVDNGAYKASAQWPNGENRIATPEDLPIQDGATYQFEIGEEAVVSTWHVIPASVQQPNIAAAWMLEVGCNAQAVAMLNQ